MHEDDKTHLILNVYAVDIEELDDNHKYMNRITLDGYICKAPTYRETPYGRQISDFLVASNRQYGKSDYIPCIVWGRNAVYASGLPVGTHLKITGRIQSRKYIKRYLDGAEEERTAYEVSVSKIEEKI